jgi:hypothetical protein
VGGWYEALVRESAVQMPTPICLTCYTVSANAVEIETGLDCLDREGLLTAIQEVLTPQAGGEKEIRHCIPRTFTETPSSLYSIIAGVRERARNRVHG